MDILQYVYISRRLGNFADLGLTDLANKSAQANAKFSITGFLVHYGNFFWQYIEGDKLNIENLVSNLRDDKRHDIISEYFSYTHCRKFPSWSMKLVSKDIGTGNKVFDFDMTRYVENLAKKSLDQINENIHDNLWKAVNDIADLYRVSENLMNKNIEDEFLKIDHYNVVTIANTLRNELDIANNDLETSEENLSKALKEATIAKNEAERSNEAKRIFLANISHEIRTPLTSIIGFLELIKENTDSSCYKTQKYIQNIANSANHLNDLVGDVLDFSKIESNKFEVNIQELDIVKEVMKIKSVFMEKSIEKSIKFNVLLNTSINKIQSDPQIIRQILLNIIGNSFKFTDKGLVEITIDEKMNGRNFVVIIVKDTGIGIDHEYKNQIFSPFEQAPRGKHLKSAGTGLGLSISKKLAQMLGGDLLLEETSTDKINHGTTFNLIIPTNNNEDFRNVRESSSISQEKKLTIKGRNILKGKRILIGEDNLDILELLTSVLSAEGVITEKCLNGSEVLSHQLESFDLILLDIQMPVCDGIETVKSIRKRDYHKPVIALSADATIEQKNLCLESGFSEFYTKPITPKTLIDVIGKSTDKLH